MLIPFCRADIDIMLKVRDEIDDISVLDFWGDEIRCDLSKFFIELKKCSFFVTERLHATVFATLLGIPFMSLAYKPKCYDFIDSFYLDKKVIFNQDSLDAIDLFCEFNKLKDDNDLYDEITCKVEEFRGKLKLASEEIRLVISKME